MAQIVEEQSSKVITNDKHTVAVIIPTVGRGSIKQCEDTLKIQTREPDEIIVIYDEEQRGPSWARNEGIRKAKGNLIAYRDYRKVLSSVGISVEKK